MRFQKAACILLGFRTAVSIGRSKRLSRTAISMRCAALTSALTACSRGLKIIRIFASSRPRLRLRGKRYAGNARSSCPQLMRTVLRYAAACHMIRSMCFPQTRCALCHPRGSFLRKMRSGKSLRRLRKSIFRASGSSAFRRSFRIPTFCSADITATAISGMNRRSNALSRRCGARSPTRG